MALFNKFSKENLVIGFYILYFTISGLLYWLFPGDAKMPNMGITMLFLFVPISFVYASIQVYKHFTGTISYAKCLLIHAVAWTSLIVVLNSLTIK